MTPWLHVAHNKGMTELPAGRTEAGRFAPGHSGNPAGRQREEFSFMGILRAALAEENRAGRSVGERIVRRYIKLALGGNQQAAEALMARIDGKPAQSLTLKGDTDAPLHVRHSARLEVAPKPELPASGHAQDAVEGEAVEHPFASLAHAMQDIDGNALVPERDPDHQGPDVTEKG